MIVPDRNWGASLDRLASRLPPGPAREFVESLPRRQTVEQARANSLALLTLIEQSPMTGTATGRPDPRGNRASARGVGRSGDRVSGP